MITCRQLRMESSTLFIGLILSLGLCVLTEDGVSTEATSVTCKLQGTTRLPAFSMDGDFLIGGVFSIHYYMQTVKHNYTTMPEPLRCRGRLVRRRNGAY